MNPLRQLRGINHQRGVFSGLQTRLSFSP